MAPVDPNLIAAAPSSKEALLNLLFEGLDWPRPAHLEIENIDLIDWRPEDLHLESSALARIKEIQQLPKLTATQSFGVFIIEFEPGRLPIGALRLIVHSLVRRNRARSPKGAGMWHMTDLLFFCQAEAGGRGVLHVVSFREVDKRQVLRAISWDTSSPDAKVAVLGRRLAALQWRPSDDSNDTRQAAWQELFASEYRASVRTAAQLADAMAEIAKSVRAEVQDLLAVEAPGGPLRTTIDLVRTNLREDLDEVEFANMYAQTMVYGLLVGRIAHPDRFSSASVHDSLKFETPFLDALYTLLRSPGGQEIELDAFGLHDLAAMLAETDVEGLLADFGASDRHDDPVVYFYEEFLEKYDPEERRKLGTFYTPIPVANFMVRAVDELLKDRLGLAKGVADDTDWATWAKAHNMPMPNDVASTHPVVRVLDPATGTGTFLLEWLRLAKSRLAVDSSPEGLTLESVARAMSGIEISLSSYAVAQLKVGLELPAETRALVPTIVRLSDTLAGRKPVTLVADPISQEGAEAERLKYESPVSVIIGNPPYLRTPSEGKGHSGLGGIVRFGQDGPPLLRDLTEPIREAGMGGHLKNIYNLYVYFWRWAIWKLGQRGENSPAIIAFITANSFLSGPGFGGLRKLLRKSFDELWIINLGGEGRGTRRDANVFEGVLTPVAITIAFRAPRGSEAPPRSDQDCAVHMAVLSGSREEKLGTLKDCSLSSLGWVEVEGSGLAPLVSAGVGTTFETWPRLSVLFPWQHSGIQFKRTWTISPSAELLGARWRKICETPTEARRALFVERDPVAWASTRIDPTSGVSLPGLRDVTPTSPPAAIVRYAYRTFDRQWCLADPRVAYTLRPPLWASQSSRQVFMSTLMTAPLGDGPAAVATSLVPDLHHFRGSFGAKDVIPLYRSAAGDPNCDPGLVAYLSGRFERAGQHHPASATAEDLFAYAYAVLACTDYSSRFAEELAVPGPRIPLTADAALFKAMVAIGEEGIYLHTFGERGRANESGRTRPATARWAPSPTVPPETPRQVIYNADQSVSVGDGRLVEVAPEVMDFSVSGMNVVKKWLDYRTRSGSGKAAVPGRPLDAIRPEAWDPVWSEELLQVIAAIEGTLDLQPRGAAVLEQILGGELILESELPPVPAHLTKPPSATDDGGLL